MAPPIPGLRKPVQVPTRTAGDVLIGILAIMALAVLTIGVPIALITIIGLPVPHGTASLSVLTHQLGIPSILRVLSVVIWLAWARIGKAPCRRRPRRKTTKNRSSTPPMRR